MMHEFIVNQDKTTMIKVNFIDEGVELTGETSVKGDESVALSYLPVFEADLRRNFSDLFPAPVIEGGILE